VVKVGDIIHCRDDGSVSKVVFRKGEYLLIQNLDKESRIKCSFNYWNQDRAVLARLGNTLSLKKLSNRIANLKDFPFKIVSEGKQKLEWE
jgi:hypothetical protein